MGVARHNPVEIFGEWIECGLEGFSDVGALVHRFDSGAPRLAGIVAQQVEVLDGGTPVKAHIHIAHQIAEVVEIERVRVDPYVAHAPAEMDLLVEVEHLLEQASKELDNDPAAIRPGETRDDQRDLLVDVAAEVELGLQIKVKDQLHLLDGVEDQGLFDGEGSEKVLARLHRIVHPYFKVLLLEIKLDSQVEPVAVGDFFSQIESLIQIHVECCVLVRVTFERVIVLANSFELYLNVVAFLQPYHDIIEVEQNKVIKQDTSAVFSSKVHVNKQKFSRLILDRQSFNNINDKIAIA